MTLPDHQTFRILAEQGKILVGIEPAVARKFFTDTAASVVQERIGEPITIERAAVRAAFVLGPLALLLSFYFAVVTFGWWSTLVIPVSVMIWFYHGGQVSLGHPKLLLMTIAVGVLIWLCATEPRPIYGWLLAFVAAGYLDRIRYRSAVFFLRALIIRNQKAFELLSDTITIKDA